MDRLEDAAPVRGQRRHVIRRLHYSIRTEHAYVDWIRRFILFHGKWHPAEMGAPEVEAFLTHLAVQGKVAASAQSGRVGTAHRLRPRLAHKVGDAHPTGLERARKPARLPVVFHARVRGRVPALRIGEEVSQREPRMGVAVRIPRRTSFHRSALRDRAAPSYRPHRVAARGEGSRAFRRPRKTRKLPYFSARVPPPTSWTTATTSGRCRSSWATRNVSTTMIYTPRPEPRRAWGTQPAGRRRGLARMALT